MTLDRRGFAKSLAGVVGAFAAGAKSSATPAPRPAAASPGLARAQSRLPPATITKIRVFYPLNYDRNGPQAFPQSNMVVLVDTDAGITGIGQGGSPDTVRSGLAATRERTQADEFIVACAVHDHALRRRSYELLAAL